MNEHTPTILYAEDDLSLSFVTQDNLEQAGFRVMHCCDGEEAHRCFLTHSANLCVLDIMLPKLDGFTLARKIRQANTDVPIIFLTAKSLKDDKIAGLELGADDYLTKPFSIEELILKIKVFLRRSYAVPAGDSGLITIGGYVLDLSQQRLTGPRGDKQPLTHREAELLRYLAQHKNVLRSREAILLHLWQDDDYFAGRSLDVFISRLRKYLGQDSQVSIENVHGVGFRLVIQ